MLASSDRIDITGPRVWGSPSARCGWVFAARSVRDVKKTP